MKQFFRRLGQRLKKFFFPPDDAPRWVVILPYAILGVLTIIVGVSGTYAWEYTNSTEFCGGACHDVHPLEYYAYLQSPHARVACVECHIGRAGLFTKVTRKAYDFRHVVLNMTGNYEYPIYSHAMRPAQDSCETCHYPQKFSDDSLRELVHYQTDEDNSRSSIFLLLHTGGGTDRNDIGFGIHWHIENPIEYYATDEHEQDIPYVRVLEEDGTYTEYVDVTADFDVESIDEEDLLTIDCITCHNRITHDVPKPSEALSAAIEDGLLSQDLPFVVRESTTLLEMDYPSKEEGIANMDTLAAYYMVNYPDVYAEMEDEVWQAVEVLRTIYDQNVFPDQLFDWDTHADNLGHITDPGCFRCHDGSHLTVDDEAAHTDMIRLECNLCHSIPQVMDENASTTQLELLSGPEPLSHTYTTWIALHGQAIDVTCESCHSTGDSGVSLTELVGKPPAGDYFCGNEACHSNVWTYTSFDTEEVQTILAAQLAELAPVLPPVSDSDESVPLTYDDAVGPILNSVCTLCHVGDENGGLDLTSYENLLAGGDSGSGIVAGDAEASILVQIQSSAEGHYALLKPEQLQTVIDWINAGAPESGE